MYIDLKPSFPLRDGDVLMLRNAKIPHVLKEDDILSNPKSKGEEVKNYTKY